MGLQLAADFRIFGKFWLTSVALYKDNPRPVIACVVRSRGLTEGTDKREEYPVGDVRVTAAIERQYRSSILRKKVSCLPQAFKRVHIVVKPQHREAGKHGVGVQESEDNQLILLIPSFEERASVVNNNADSRRIVGMLGVIF